MRMTAIVLTAVMLGGCAPNPELEVLHGEQLSDLSRTGVADSVHEVFRHESEAGITLGTPIYASIVATYTITREPDATLDEITDLAVADGWTLSETIFGDTWSGHKQLGELTGDLHLTFIPRGHDTPTGERGPAVITSLKARPT
jgi:hypothetical protein